MAFDCSSDDYSLCFVKFVQDAPIADPTPQCVQPAKVFHVATKRIVAQLRKRGI